MIACNSDGTITIELDGEEVTGTVAEVDWAVRQRGRLLRDHADPGESLDLETRVREAVVRPPKKEGKRTRRKEG